MPDYIEPTEEQIEAMNAALLASYKRELTEKAQLEMEYQAMLEASQNKNNKTLF